MFFCDTLVFSPKKKLSTDFGCSIPCIVVEGVSRTAAGCGSETFVAEFDNF